MTNVQSKIYLSLTILVLLIITYLVTSYDKNKQIKQKELAYIALQDTVKTYKLKNGQLVSEKKIIESSLSDLKSINKDLYTQIEKFKKELKTGKPIIYINTGVKTVDTIIIIDTMGLSITDNKLIINSKYTDSTLSILTNGYANLKTDGTYVGFNNYELTNKLSIDNLKFDILVSENGGNIFKSGSLTTSVKCNDSRFVVDSIVSWKDLPRQRFLKLRPGIMAGVIYDPWDNEVKLGLSAGLGLTFGR